MKADLHIHTTASDGSDSVEEVIDKAVGKGLDAIAITDHDNVDSLASGEKYAQGKICFIRGIEFSAYSNTEIHILGYGIDYNSDILCSRIDELLKKRRERMRKILDRLLEYNIVLDDSGLDKKCVGRVHIARKLVSGGYASSVNEAFDRYLGTHGIVYVPSGRMTPIEAVRTISEAGGVAVIAHPQKFLDNKILPSLIEGLKRYGLKGIECYYPSHSESVSRRLEAIASEYGLIKTQGSDYHGSNSSTVLGQITHEMSAKTVKGLVNGKAII